MPAGVRIGQKPAPFRFAPPTTELEFLALKWAVVDKFHDYLYWARFTVRTDNNPLTYVLTTAKLSATGHRWLALVQYRPGKTNVDADLLSRCVVGEEENWQYISEIRIRSICQRAGVDTSTDSSPSCHSLELKLHAELVKAQKDDVTLGAVISAMEEGIWPAEVDSSSELGLMKREMSRLILKDGLLHRCSKNLLGKETYQMLLPAEFIESVLISLHDDTGAPRGGKNYRVDGKREKKHCRYVAKLKNDLQEAYPLASNAADKVHQRNKRAYDGKVKFQLLDVGDRVLLRNLGLKGKHKLQGHWGSVPHLVKETADLSESSSESESERPNRLYGAYIDKLLENSVSQKKTPTLSPDKRDVQSEEDISEGEGSSCVIGLANQRYLVFAEFGWIPFDMAEPIISPPSVTSCSHSLDGKHKFRSRVQ
ncbi:hypothetical protein QQF64_027211 [Cirrhinus molitorella]|uniref:Reverse transcriptase RNase H-like domain-containing protein n=1 Tax=Cirrhinus molitorella TaxID=172907 RepID=A0ABR3NBR7_9TELE